MERRKSPYRKKIQVIINILGDIVKMDNIDRDKLVEIVKDYYNEHGIEPFRGRALPPDIYDKELASLYVVGKYGLGLDYDYPELFEKIFYKELRFDKAIEYIMDKRYEETRKILLDLSPQKQVDSNTIARMLRIIFTKTILGFEDEEKFFEVLRRVKEVFPEEERTVRNYARFYIAFKIAEGIARGDIRDRVSKEVFKQALSARLGIEKILPSDDYVREICINVFKTPSSILDRILARKEQKS